MASEPATVGKPFKKGEMAVYFRPYLGRYLFIGSSTGSWSGPAAPGFVRNRRLYLLNYCLLFKQAGSDLPDGRRPEIALSDPDIW